MGKTPKQYEPSLRVDTQAASIKQTIQSTSQAARFTSQAAIDEVSNGAVTKIGGMLSLGGGFRSN